MDWLFDNLGKLAPLVIFLLYMISSVKKGGKEEEAPDPEAAERARKIQEEIRRKILERQRGGAEPSGRPPQPVEEEILFYDEEPEQREVTASPRLEPVATREQSVPVPSVMVDPYVEKRREIEAQLAAAKQKRKEALQKAKSLRKGKPGKSRSLQPIASREIGQRLRENLGDKKSLKTAILLKEVLDSPVSMR